MNNIRKATDVLLELETKINALISLVKNQDLLLKVLSNKMNNFLETKTVPIENKPKFIVESEFNSVEPTIKVELETNIKDVRRTSRTTVLPETKNKVKEPEIIIPVNNSNSHKHDSQNEESIPIIQRVIDTNNKPVFLAEVILMNMDTGEKVSKTRTNGAGKWMQSLPKGKYEIYISRKESITKKKLEATQEIVIDGTKIPLELETIKIKAL